MWCVIAGTTCACSSARWNPMTNKQRGAKGQVAVRNATNHFEEETYVEN